MAKKKPTTKAKIVTPGPPPKEAIDWFSAKGLKVGFNHTDVWKEEHNTAFTVAKVTDLNVLQFAKDTAQAALEDGTTFADFKKTLGPKLDQSGWANYGGGRKQASRLRVIFETNMRTARAAGQWQRIERTKKLMPYLRYGIGPSVRHRPEHLSWDGVILPVDDQFWDAHMPPNGWLCKCHVIQESKSQVDREGGVTLRPSSKPVVYINPSTGKKEKVPIGIDPGWNYNPGKNRDKGVDEAAKKVGVPPVPKTKKAKPKAKPAAPPEAKKKAKPKAKPKAKKPKDPFTRVNGKAVTRGTLKHEMLGDAKKFDQRVLGKALMDLAMLSAKPGDTDLIVAIRDAGKEVRKQINHLLAKSGMISTDVLLDSKLVAHEKRTWDASRLSLEPLTGNTAGFHDWNGRTVLKDSQEYRRDLRKIGAQMLRGGPLTSLSGGTLYTLGVLIHEACHDTSPGLSGSYSKGGKLLEEASTEMAASRVFEQLVPGLSKRVTGKREGASQESGSGYREFQIGLMEATKDFRGKTKISDADIMEEVTAASIAMRTTAITVIGVRGLQLEFLAQLPKSKAARKIKEAMDEAEKKWQENIAEQTNEPGERGKFARKRAANPTGAIGAARQTAAEKVIRADPDLAQRVERFIATSEDYYNADPDPVSR